MINIEKNLIAPDQWDNIERIFEQTTPADGKSTAGLNIQHLKQSSIYNNDCSYSAIFTKEVKDRLNKLLHGFYQANTRFSSYKKGDFYGWHVDSQHTNRHGGCNSVAYTCFLSNPSEYEGGELEIDTEAGIHRIKLNKGDMVVYPAYYLHRVRKIKKGIRKVCVGWIRSHFPDPKDRFTLTRIEKVATIINDLYLALEKGEEKKAMLEAYTQMHFIRTQFQRKCYNNL